uniref:Protein phosphatase 1, regulatory subunit 12C n=1 Tax=Astyanax mexicanus TaxID=7994 RepID=A0A8B9GS57_ASTMX
MAATDRSRSEAAKQRRQDQLARWQGSETDLTGAQVRGHSGSSGSVSSSGRRPKVRFAQGAVFMAACSAGDREEVAELLRQGADINHANVDGLTALHQACIDENAEMVQFLVESGSDVNRGDNEGWTPLHAAASCGFIQIAKSVGVRECVCVCVCVCVCLCLCSGLSEDRLLVLCLFVLAMLLCFFLAHVYTMCVRVHVSKWR